jgi:hypothetical protein
MFTNKDITGSSSSSIEILYTNTEKMCRESCDTMNDPYLECGALGNNAKVMNCYNKIGGKRLDCRRHCN